MFKISVVDTPAQCRLVLEGKLIEPWVSELNKTWKAIATDLDGRELVIDLGTLTSISQEGENTLLELMRYGAKFRCRGVFTKYIVQQLSRRHKSSASRRFPANSGEAQEKNQ